MIAVIPSTISEGVLGLRPVLLVPIMMTAALGVIPLMLPLSSRHSTFSVRSPLTPRLTAFLSP